MKLGHDPESSWDLAIFIPEVDTPLFQVQHSVKIGTGNQKEKISSEKAVGRSLAMVLCHIVNSIVHLLMDRRDIGPCVVYSRSSATASDGIGLVYQSNPNPFLLTRSNRCHASSQATTDDQDICFNRNYL